MRRLIIRLLTVLTAMLMVLTTASPAGAQIPEERPLDFGTPCIQLTDSVYRLYAAYFLRLPDMGGFEYWQNQYRGGLANLDQISDAFGASEEFQLTYGNLTNAQFVDLVYRNVMGRQPDAEGFQYWLDQLNAGQIDRGDLMSFFSESEEFVLKTGTAPPLAGYFSQYPTGTTFRCGFESVVAPEGPNDVYLDVHLINHTDTPVTASIDMLAANGTVVDSWSGEISPGNDLLAASYQKPANVVEYRITFTTGIAWAIVGYPEFHGTERPGWERSESATSAASLAAEFSE